MKFSVAICTWNRAAQLDQTLASLAHLRVPNNCQWEVVVVENNCVDSTAAVCRKWTERLPLNIYSEPKQGQAFARNRAIRNCHSDVILWIDDDVETSQEWMASYQQAIERDSSKSFWGGPIRPRFTGRIPDWLSENWARLQLCFSAHELSRQGIELTNESLPYGANFAVRCDVQKQFPFDVNLGHHGKDLAGDEVDDLLRRLLVAGYSGQWVPEAIVEHVIPQSRATLDHVYRFYFEQGRQQAATAHAAVDTQGPRRGWRREAFVQKRLFQLKYFFAPSSTWLNHWIRAAVASGQAAKRSESEIS